jgi:hypothetical protein
MFGSQHDFPVRRRRVSIPTVLYDDDDVDGHNNINLCSSVRLFRTIVITTEISPIHLQRLPSAA